MITTHMTAALSLAAMLVCHAPSLAQTLYVDIGSGSDTNSGTSRLAPLQNLRTALDRAAADPSVTDIRATGGTHTPGSLRSSTFRLVDGVTIRGGYLPGFLLQSVAFRTVLSGEIGDPSDPADNCRTVVTAVNVDGARLEDLTIGDGHGGSPTAGLKGTGAGLRVRSSRLTIDHCRFRDNHANSHGGAIYTVNECSVGIADTTFIGNSAGTAGGAVSATVNYNTSADVAINRCRFLGNEALQGGAIHMGLGDIAVWNSAFSGNQAPLGNATARGGAIYCSGFTDDVKFIGNCSLTDNEARDGGGIYIAQGAPAVTNSIVYGNRAAAGYAAEIQVAAGAAPDISHCCALGAAGLPGTGNFDDDPNMIDPEGRDGEEGTDDDDLRIPHPALADSPCVDAGDNARISGAHLQLDLDREARKQHPYTHWTGTPQVDVGAYEVAPITRLHRARTGDGLALRALVGGLVTHVAGSDAVEVRAGDRLDLRVESPRGRYAGALGHLALDLMPTTPPIGMPAGFLVGHSSIFLTVGSVPTSLGAGLQIPQGLAGVELLAQAFVFDPSAPNGLARVSDGRELRCR